MKLLFGFLAVLAVIIQVHSDTCKPGDNCKAPDCRCWFDKTIPGGLKPRKTPQMVVLSFEYAVNSPIVKNYSKLVKGIQNPNGCEPRATFFVQKAYTDFKVVKNLYNQGHDIGVTSPTGQVPGNASEWMRAFQETKAAVVKAGVPEAAVQGARGPTFYAGGNEQFKAMNASALTYDSTCLTIDYMSQDTYLWPFTYDFVEGTPKCVEGSPPSVPFKGQWQFIVADLEVKGHKCATLSGCASYLGDTKDVFDFLYNTFAAHYDQKNRAPFILSIDPSWLLTQYHADGTYQFLQFIRTAFDDVWIVSTRQALDWMKDPVNSKKALKFKPWGC